MKLIGRSNSKRLECSCHGYQHSLLETDSVLDLMKQAVEKKLAFSLTRFSHAEISYLNWKINPILQKNYERFRKYSGMTGTTEEVANKLLHSLDNTDLVGLVPKDCEDNGKWWYANTTAFLHHVNRIPSKICSVWVTQELINKQDFWDFLKKYRVALIGRRALEASPYFTKKGIQITEIKNLEGIEGIHSVYDHMVKSNNWDIALISAAIPATILTPSLATDSGRVVIDFGHAMDIMIEGEQFDIFNSVEEWEDKL